MKRARIRKKPYTYNGKTQDRWVVTPPRGKGRPEKWFRSLSEAEMYAVKVDAKLAVGAYGTNPAKTTFRQVCEEWLEEQERRADRSNRNADLGVGSLILKRRAVKGRLIPRFGDMKLHDIESKHVQSLVNDLAHDLSRSTAQTYRSYMKQVLDFAVTNKYLGINPLTREPVKVPGKSHGREDVPERDDIYQVLVTLDKPRPSGVRVAMWEATQVQVVLGALMGLRPGEIGALQWEDVDLDGWTIRIRHTLTPYSGLGDPKTPGSVRTLDLDKITHRVLTAHARRSRSRKGFVLETNICGCVHVTTLHVRHRMIFRAAGLVDENRKPICTPHALRHFAGSVWLSQGMSLKDVSWRLGHVSIRTTERIYLHQLRINDQAKHVMTRLSDLFPDIAGTTRAPMPVAEIADGRIIDVEANATPLMLAPPPTALPAPKPVINFYPPRGADRKLEDAPRWVDDAIRMIGEGATVVEIARRLQRGEKVISDWLKLSGISHPGREASRARAVNREARFTELWEQGYQLMDIARESGYSERTVRDWVKEQGLTREK